ncbi:MAG: MATE family efflux transporter, partial [Lachnospiraceae bacterium]|nr:MATE family efflux transporter [Lachnospiraceae bacterium]
LCNQKRLLHIQRTFRFQLDGKMIKRILYIGIPSGMENSMFQLGKILVLSLISTFGTYAIAANAVSNAVAMIQILPGMAITLAVTTVIARCVGAGDYEQVHYYTKKLNILTILAQCVSNGIIFLLLPFILQAYNLSDLTARTALHILLFHAVMSIIIWPFAFTLPATLRAAGDVKFTMGISIISMWVFRIVLSYVLAGYMGLGVFGVWVAMVIDWCFRAICFIIRYVRGKWKYKCAV